MAFILFTKESEDVYLTIDNTGRIYLSAELMRTLDGHKKGATFSMYFDPDKKLIGIKRGNTDKADHVRVDDRGYGSIRRYLNRFSIDYRGESIRYNYDGDVDGIMSFRLEVAEYGRTALRQEKNGNLERIQST